MLDENHAWVITNELAYEFDYSYNIKYQIEKSLIAIDNLYNPNIIELNKYESRCAYFHVQCDLIIDSGFLICNRFNKYKKNQGQIKHIDNAINNYHFDIKDYHNLSVIKEARNILEHYDEKSMTYIDKDNGVCGFNAIYDGMDEKTYNDLKTSKLQIYLLNLEENTITVTRHDREFKENFCINIIELKKELLKLQKINLELWNYITMI